MSRRVDGYGNAPMESFFNTLLREPVHRRRYCKRAKATEELGDCIVLFYDRQRRSFQPEWMSAV